MRRSYKGKFVKEGRHEGRVTDDPKRGVLMGARLEKGRLRAKPQTQSAHNIIHGLFSLNGKYAPSAGTGHDPAPKY